VRTKDMRIGMRVRVHDDHGNPPLRGLVGIIQRRYWDDGNPSFEVWFRHGRTERFWHHELERAT
jgi:hypothetical protein